MPWNVTIRSNNDPILGKCESVIKILDNVFPGIDYWEEPSGAEKVKDAESQGVNYPASVRHDMMQTPSYLQACYAVGNSNILFKMASSGEVDEISISVRGSDNPLPCLQRFADYGWNVIEECSGDPVDFQGSFPKGLSDYHEHLRKDPEYDYNTGNGIREDPVSNLILEDLYNNTFIHNAIKCGLYDLKNGEIRDVNGIRDEYGLNKIRTCLWTETAIDHLDRIKSYIDQDSPENALDVINKITLCSDFIVSSPTSGSRVPEEDVDGVLEIYEGDYRIFYHYDSCRLVVLGVITIPSIEMEMNDQYQGGAILEGYRRVTTSQLIGTWITDWDDSDIMHFLQLKTDGSFLGFSAYPDLLSSRYRGVWSVKNGCLYLSYHDYSGPDGLIYGLQKEHNENIAGPMIDDYFYLRKNEEEDDGDKNESRAYLWNKLVMGKIDKGLHKFIKEEFGTDVVASTQ